MLSQHRIGMAAAATLAAVLTAGAVAHAQTTQGFVTSFEPAGPTEVTYPAGYTTGSLLFQDQWTGSGNFPRVQTAQEISDELTAAGLNPANPVHSGNQALMVTKIDTVTETTGYFVRNTFTTPNVLETATKVTVDFWVRPLTSGLGANPAGTPAGNEKTIGERQGNVFFGIAGDNDGSSAATGQRAAAIRFGVDTSGSDPYTNVLERHIDFASETAGTAVWVKSGLLWEADQWYNLRMDLDFTTKTYDVFVNDMKANASPITFYHPAATSAQRFFVSRGTNQAGVILDDISVTPYVEPPPIAGDFDDNGVVDGADFLLWQQDTNIGSLDDWKTNFGMSSSTAAVGAVPEPTGATLAIGMMLLTAGGRLAARRRSAVR
jgi:hypothetical protein